MLIDDGNLDVYIPKKEKEMLEIRQKITRLKACRIKYPKLRLGWDRWHNECFYSPEVNAIANKIDMHYSCGCCADSPLIVGCYIESNGLRIYGDPFEICVGEKNSFGSGNIPSNNWEDHVLEKGYSQIIIDQIEQYFLENPREDCKD